MTTRYTTIDTHQDYEIAREELVALFASLALPVTISEPIGQVGENDWPCIAFSVTIGSERFDWRMGIGHVNWKKAAANPFAHKIGGDDLRAVELVANGKTLKDRARTASLAECIAKVQKVTPSAAEVLADACRNGIDADESFGSWCANLGYEEDSRKAEQTYRECTETGKRARRLVGAALYLKFAELSARL